MHEYIVDSVALLRKRGGLEIADDYTQIITRRETEGWEFVQAIPLESNVTPKIDLLFRRRNETQ